MRVYDPEVIAELGALLRNDVETLTGMFWSAPQTTRFGVSENLHGFEEIVAF